MAIPPRLTAQDFDPRVLQLFDEYVHGDIDRRGFLAGAARLAIGASAAAGLLAALTPRFAAAQVVPADDPRVSASYVEFDSPAGHGRGRGYLVRPAQAADAPALVLVVHENRGLNPHIEDVARRLAIAGYLAFAPDALFPRGGYPGDEDAARAEFARLDQDKTRQDMLAAVRLLQSISASNGRLGAVGFCWGGATVNWLATQVPELAAAAPFYGSAPPSPAVEKIRARMLVVLADTDERVNAGWPEYELALKAAGVRYELFRPPGTQHGFHNDTTPRYDADAAAAAWMRLLGVFAAELRS